MNKALMVLSLSVTACHVGGRDRARQVLATVNGIPITADELRRRAERARIDDEDGKPFAAPGEVQKRALLDDVIVRRLLLQEAERLNVLVGSDEVEAAYVKLRAGWKDEDFEAMLKEKDLTQAELKTEIREQLMMRRYFRTHVFARIAVTDGDITKYIEEHPDVQVAPEVVHALHIVVKTEEKARMIAQEIRKGLPFEDAAMKYSLSPEAKNGGALGSFSRGTLPQIFEEACFTTPLGQMSKVVASDYGFHLFKVVERRDAHVRQLYEVRDEVERTLRSDAERLAQDKKIEELKQRAEIVVHDDQLAHIH
ncbi:MAG: peptidylprolyl isomerase [Deltaproteobacteria bacterium]|nr:peptidylprolyl isomerase [Deltaproteobacteria bacterium]